MQNELTDYTPKLTIITEQISQIKIKLQTSIDRLIPLFMAL